MGADYPAAKLLSRGRAHLFKRQCAALLLPLMPQRASAAQLQDAHNRAGTGAAQEQGQQHEQKTSRLAGVSCDLAAPANRQLSTQC